MVGLGAEMSCTPFIAGHGRYAKSQKNSTKLACKRQEHETAVKTRNVTDKHVYGYAVGTFKDPHGSPTYSP